MSELKRVKRPIRTMDSFESNTLDIDSSISKENTFKGLCAKKAIKPGMMVRNFSVKKSRISLEYEEMESDSDFIKENAVKLFSNNRFGIRVETEVFTSVERDRYDNTYEKNAYF